MLPSAQDRYSANCRAALSCSGAVDYQSKDIATLSPAVIKASWHVCLVSTSFLYYPVPEALMTLRTHLDVLNDSSVEYSERAVFQLPVPSAQRPEDQEWQPVTYAQFKRDVETYAKFWSRQLAACGLPGRSVVGLWCVQLVWFVVYI